MQKKLLVLLLVILLMVGVAGCGNAKNGSSEQNSISKPIVPSITEPELEPFSLTFDTRDIGVKGDISFTSSFTGKSSMFDCAECGLISYFSGSNEYGKMLQMGLMNIDTLEFVILADERIEAEWKHHKNCYITIHDFENACCKIYDSSGNKIFQTPTGISAGEVSDGVFYFYDKAATWRAIDGQTGFMDFNGNVVISPPANHSFSSVIANGVFAVSNEKDPKADAQPYLVPKERQGTWAYQEHKFSSYIGYMNLDGELKVDFSNVAVVNDRWVSNALPFEDGEAIIEIEESEWYVIDLEGNIVEQLDSDPNPIGLDEYEQLGFEFEQVFDRDNPTAILTYKGDVVATIERDTPAIDDWGSEMIYIQVEQYIVMINCIVDGSVYIELADIEEMHGFTVEENESGHIVQSAAGETPLKVEGRPDALSFDPRKDFIPVNENYMFVRIYDEHVGAYYCLYDKYGNLYSDMRYSDVIVLVNGNFIGTTFYDYDTVRAEMENNYNNAEEGTFDLWEDPAKKENHELGNYNNKLNQLEYYYTLVTVGNNQ